MRVERIVLAANTEVDQPWVAETAAQLARENGAQVSILSVDELASEMLSTMPRENRVAQAEQAAQRAYEIVRAGGIEATKTVRSGPALDRILQFAEEENADLIVVGSSARGRLATAVLGSVPLGLVQRSRRPVLVVTGPGDAA